MICGSHVWKKPIIPDRLVSRARKRVENLSLAGAVRMMLARLVQVQRHSVAAGRSHGPLSYRVDAARQMSVSTPFGRLRPNLGRHKADCRLSVPQAPERTVPSRPAPAVQLRPSRTYRTGPQQPGTDLLLW